MKRPFVILGALMTLAIAGLTAINFVSADPNGSNASRAAAQLETRTFAIDNMT